MAVDGWKVAWRWGAQPAVAHEMCLNAFSGRVGNIQLGMGWLVVPGIRGYNCWSDQSNKDMSING